MNNGTEFSPLAISSEKKKCLSLPLNTPTSGGKKQKPKWFWGVIEVVLVLSFLWSRITLLPSSPPWIRTSH